METKAESRVSLLQATECQGWPAGQRKREAGGHGTDAPSCPQVELSLPTP